MKRATLLTTAALVALASGASALAQSDVPGVNPSAGIPASQMPSVLSQVSFDQRLNEPLPLALLF